MIGSTPRSDGFRLPARFCEHQRTLMSWPCREDLFGPLMGDARREWAEVACGIDRFEPITVVVDPAQEAEARSLLGPDFDILVMPLDDSWIRDNGPIFVRDAHGRVAAVRFRFDGWNQQFTPYDKDAEVPGRIAKAWGVRLYEAPFTLEGGAFNTDGEGTLLTDRAVPAAQPQSGLEPRRQRSAAARVARDRSGRSGCRSGWLRTRDHTPPRATSTTWRSSSHRASWWPRPHRSGTPTTPACRRTSRCSRRPPTPPAASSRSSSWICFPTCSGVGAGLDG